MSTALRPLLLRARGLLCRAEGKRGTSEGPARVLRDAGLLVSGGVVREVVAGAAACRRLVRTRGAALRDLGDVYLLPGLVNAHAHLELTGLEGTLPRDAGFGAWVGALLKGKAERGPAGLCSDARRGLARALGGGTTTVGDVASTAATLAALGRGPRPRLRLFREVLDAWDPARTEAALANLEPWLGETARLFEGFSPHAPFTVSEALLHGLARLRRRRLRPLTMHWAETQAELDWMQSGTGDFKDVLGPSPGRAGLELLDDAGLLGPWTSLVHGNLPARGELARIAAAGASLVHCPGTHAFFGREAFPLRAYLDAGVNIALGTDSLASNDSLDLRVEARRLLEREPSLTPAQVLGMATAGGAEALGLGDRVGRLEAGFFADGVALPLGHEAAWPGPEELAAALFAPGPEPRAAALPSPVVLVGGRIVSGA